MLKSVICLFNMIHIGMVYVAKAMIVAMVLLIFANVVLRYGFKSGIFWSEEIALLLEVWFIFIAMGLGVKHGLHINIQLINPDKAPRWLNLSLNRLRDVVVIIVGVVMLRYGWSLVGFAMKSIMPATGLPQGLLYAALPFGAVIVLYEAVMEMLGIDTNDAAVDAFLSGTGSFDAAMGEPDA